MSESWLGRGIRFHFVDGRPPSLRRKLLSDTNAQRSAGPMLGLGPCVLPLAAACPPPSFLPLRWPTPPPRHLGLPRRRRTIPPTPALPNAATQQRSAARTRTPSGAAISPDGATVAWSVREGPAITLHLTPVAGTDASRTEKDQIVAPDGATDCANTAPVWSPDGATLAFTSTCAGAANDPGQEQIFLWSKADAKVRQLTHLKGNIQQAAWSPDGKSIAFLFVENATRSAGALDAMKPFAGVIGEDGVEVQRVYAVDVTSGTGAYLTPLTLHAFEFNWAPSSKEIAFIGADAPRRKQLVGRQALGRPPSTSPPTLSPSSPRLILDPTTVPGPLHGLQMAVPRFSPDGQQIAFIGGLMSDQGSTGGDVYLIPATGGTPTDITPNIDSTPTFIDWLAPNALGLVEDRRGHTRLVGWDVENKTALGIYDLGFSTLSGGPIKNAVSPGPDNTVALVKSSLTAPAEVWAGHPDDLQQITHLHDASTPKAPHIESVEWENDGFHVQGWLTYPTNYDPNRKTKYPLIVTVHGGPSASAFPRGAQYADAGYFEFQPNPRGSYGQGEAFVQANRKDFGYGDLRDILKGMDTLEAKYPIDKRREGLTGWSYGGFMTMFGVTQTTRFAAAVAGAGISDWLSYYGENSIDQWMTPFFGASVYDDPAIYAKSSAITYIKKVKTPTLIIVGDRDGECPAPQSFEMWHALRAEGVKTQLVIYPAEGHRFKDPAHIADRDARILKWFADNMKGSE